MRNLYFYPLSENRTHCTQSEKEVFDLLAWVIRKNVKCVWLHSIFANKIITKYWCLILLTTRRPLSRRPTVRFPTGPGKGLPVWWGRSEHVRGAGLGPGPKSSCRNLSNFCFIRRVVYKKIHFEGYTKDQYIWYENNITQLYFILGTAELHWNVSSWLRDAPDI